MFGNFDPYQQWLGIPPEEQPPNLYRLIGINVGESDVKLIRQAASQQGAHVKALRTDENAIFADLLIKEINEAGKILLDPEKKKKYDRTLPAEHRSRPPATPAPSSSAASDSQVLSDVPSAGSSVGRSDVHATAASAGLHDAATGRSGVDAAARQSGVLGGTTTAAEKKRGGSIPTWVYLALGGGLGFLGVAAGVLLVIVFSRGPGDAGAGDGTTVAEQDDSPDTTREQLDGSLTGAAEGVLQIEPVADVTVAPGCLVRVPIVIADQPVATRCKLVTGPPEAEIPDFNNVFVWQTSPADAGAEHAVTVIAEHPERTTGQTSFTIRVGEANQPVDLLDLVDVTADAVSGTWHMEAGSLIAPNEPDRPRLEVPFAPPESYDLRLDVEKLTGASGLHIGLVCGPARWSVLLDGPSGSGLMRLDGKDYHVNVTSYRDTVLSGGRKSNVLCRVRPAQVQVVCDGRLIVNFRGELSRLSPHDDWSAPHGEFLSLGSHEASYGISNVVLTPVPPGSADPSHPLGDEIPGLVEFEGHYYRAYFDRVPWADARQRCEQLGGYLACIGSGLEQTYVAGNRGRTQIWLGGTDGQEEGTWQWIDGSPLAYTHWSAGRPDNVSGNEHFLSMMASGTWDDEPGTRQLGYVCEWDARPGTEPIRRPPPPVVAVAPEAEVRRVAVPGQTEVETYVTQFRTFLERQPLDTREKRISFVRRMIDAAKDREKQPAERYVRLRESQRLAAEHGHVDLAVEAIDELADQFDVDPLAEKQRSVVKAFRASTTPEQALAAKTQLARVIDDALKRDACDLAMQAVQAGYNESLKSDKKQFQPEFYELRKKVQPQYEEWQQFARVEADLKKNPADPAANLQVGRRYCFRRGNWQEGLPLLAKGGDPNLRALAEAELAGPTTPAEQVKLADAWWNAAASDGPAAGRPAHDHAGQWYERARGEGADADQLAHIDSRLQQLARLDEPAVPETPGEEPPPQFDLTKLGMFDGRSGETRRVLLQARGGNPATEAAVAAALKWLAEHQMPDGGWSFDHAVATGGVGSNGGSMPQARNAATGLVLLAFLGAGQTHKSGTYRDKIEQGIRFLGTRVKVQENRVGSFHEEGGTLYSHGIAAQALCEAYALTKDKSLLVPSQMALAYTVRSQHPMKGGWRYKPRQEGDTSVTGWQLSALKLGSEAGITPPTAALALTGRFLDSVQYDGGAKYGYTAPGGSDSTTAIGLLCRIHLGWPRDHAALRRGVTHLTGFHAKDKPLYFSYYTTQVLQNYGGQPWDEWNAAVRDFLLTKQATQGPAAGSWWISGKHSGEGGRLCSTALATLILESYYRYLPVYADTRQEISRRAATAGE